MSGSNNGKNALDAPQNPMLLKSDAVPQAAVKSQSEAICALKTHHRDSFIFYRSFLNGIIDLPANQFKEAALALCLYAFDGTEIKIKGCAAKTFFIMAKPGLDKALSRYDKQIESGNKGGEHGKKGGNPNFIKGQPNPYYIKKITSDITPNITPKITPDITGAQPLRQPLYLKRKNINILMTDSQTKEITFILGCIEARLNGFDDNFKTDYKTRLMDLCREVVAKKTMNINNREVDAKDILESILWLLRDKDVFCETISSAEDTINKKKPNISNSFKYLVAYLYNNSRGT